MLKFKFNYLNNTLAYQKEENTWLELPKENKFSTKYNGQGFNLDLAVPHWITFTVYPDKIRVFYKQEKEEIVYYRKDLPKQEEVIFELEETDKVEKKDGKWVRKSHE